MQTLTSKATSLSVFRLHSWMCWELWRIPACLWLWRIERNGGTQQETQNTDSPSPPTVLFTTLLLRYGEEDHDKEKRSWSYLFSFLSLVNILNVSNWLTDTLCIGFSRYFYCDLDFIMSYKILPALVSNRHFIQIMLKTLVISHCT